MNRFAFHPLARSDREQLERWFSDAEVQRWYGSQAEVDKILSYIDNPRVDPVLVALHGTPIAYLQSYAVHAWADHPYRMLPEGTIGLDTFIGPAEFRGRGIGPAYLSQFAADGFARNIPMICIDPDPDNRRAISAYESIGFVPRKDLETEWGRVVLMTLTPATLRSPTPSP